MGQMSFRLPPGLPADMTRELERACLAGGFDNAPTPTQVQFSPGHLTVARQLDESGYLITPWDISGVGRLMATTATLRAAMNLFRTAGNSARKSSSMRIRSQSGHLAFRPCPNTTSRG